MSEAALAELANLQHETIEAMNAHMRVAATALADAKLAILVQQSTTANLERTLARIVGTLDPVLQDASMAEFLAKKAHGIALDAIRGKLEPMTPEQAADRIRVVVDNARRS